MGPGVDWGCPQGVTPDKNIGFGQLAVWEYVKPPKFRQNPRYSLGLSVCLLYGHSVKLRLYTIQYNSKPVERILAKLGTFKIFLKVGYAPD